MVIDLEKKTTNETTFNMKVSRVCNILEIFCLYFLIDKFLNIVC